MAKLSDGSQEKILLLLWGPAMCGKTVLASQFPNPHFIDLDGQMGSVRSLAKQQGVEVDFPVIHIDESETTDPDFLELAGKQFGKQTAWTKTKKLVETWSRKLTKEDTLILDNLSRAAEYLLNHIKQKSGHNPLQIQDWGTFVDEMKIMVDYLQSNYAKSNAVVIGHEDVKKDDLSGQLLKSLLMPTSFSQRLPSKSSDFLYMKTDVTGPKSKRKVTRILQSVPDPANPTGSRSLIPNLENPSYAKMKSYIESYLGRKLGDPTWTPKEEDIEK